MNKTESVESYIRSFPEDMQVILEQVRKCIKEAAPEAEEVISYQMPAYKMNNVLVYFAAQKKHLGFYPTPSAIKAFSDELSGFKSSKGAVQFPLDKPLPLDLIERMVRFRVMENTEKRQKIKV